MAFRGCRRLSLISIPRACGDKRDGDLTTERTEDTEDEKRERRERAQQPRPRRNGRVNDHQEQIPYWNHRLRLYTTTALRFSTM